MHGVLKPILWRFVDGTSKLTFVGEWVACTILVIHAHYYDSCRSVDSPQPNISVMSLFDSALLTTTSTTLPSTISIRPLQLTDHGIGYDSILSQLSPDTEPPLSLQNFKRQFRVMAACDPRQYYIVVLVENNRSSGTTSTPSDRIIGTATLLVESKFLRSGSLAGHIEDVVVASTHRGLKLGQVLISTLTRLAKQIGCYKVILDCSEHNVGFYEKCGYARKGVEMKLYL